MPLHLGNSIIETVGSYEALAAQPGMLQAVSVAQEPTKLEYITGETIDPTGLILNVTIDGNTYQIGPEGTGDGADKYIKVDATMGGTILNASEYTGVTVQPWVSLNNNNVQSSNGFFISIADGPAVDTVLENNSWETIAQIAAAGEAQEYWNVGDTKNLTIGEYNYPMTIVAFNHYDLATNDTTYNNNSGKTAITFWMKDGWLVMGQMNSAFQNGCTLYTGSDMYKTTLPRILADFPTELSSKLRAPHLSGWNETSFSPKIFLPAMKELGGPLHRLGSDNATEWAWVTAGNTESYSPNKIWTRTTGGWSSAAQESYFGTISQVPPADSNSMTTADLRTNNIFTPVFNL